MNPASKSPLPVMLDPVAAAIIAQLRQTIAEQNQQIARSQQALATTEMRVQKLEEELRLERIKKYGLRALHRAGCSHRSDAGTHRAQVDLFRRNDHQFFDQQVCRQRALVSSTRDSAARSRSE